MGNRKSIILILIAICMVTSCILHAAKGEASGSADSLYVYDPIDPPDVFFFPKEKARWDGSKVTLREWYTLTDLQKQRFISEYLTEVSGRQGISTDNISFFDYLKTLNLFSYYSNDNCVNVPSSKVIDKLLSGQGRMGQKITN